MVLLVFSFSGFLQAFDINEVIVPGKVPICLSALFSHIRLIEFVLETRLTTSQKDRFREVMETECAKMDDQERLEFLQGEQLFKSMTTMKEYEIRAIKDVLAADYESTADETEGDPSAQLFKEVMAAVSDFLTESEEYHFSRQAFNGFVEYIEFVNGLPGPPKKLADKFVEQLEVSLKRQFPKLSELGQEKLNGFERRWHVFKAAWMAADSAKKTLWIVNVRKPFTATPTVSIGEEEFLYRVLETHVWEEMASFAASLGETETGWIGKEQLPVW